MRQLTAAFWVLLVAQSVAGAVPSLAEVRARNLEVVTSEGERVPLATLLPEGRAVVVEFWATWCVPCRKTIPHLIALSKRYPDALTIVGLTVEDPTKDRSKVQKFVSDVGINYQVVFAPKEIFRFMNQRDRVGIPKILVYDRRGGVVEHIIGYNPFTNRHIERAVARALRE